jgi:plastocyanin
MTPQTGPQARPYSGPMSSAPTKWALVLVISFVLAALLGVGDGAAVQAQNPRLVATVGPTAVISLRTPTGALVSKVDPGTYDIEVNDLSNEHNFHLTGIGVDRRTAIEGTGTETWTVTFVNGTYRYVCDPHSSSMRGTFVAGTPPQATRPAITAKTRLVLTSGPTQKITLRTAGGKPVVRMKRGTYTIIVKDRAVNHNARIVAPGFRKATTLAFVGSPKPPWKAKLSKVGTLRFLCDPHAVLGMKGSAKIVR